LRRFRPDVIEGWPSSIALLAALMVEAKETLAVRAINTSSEVMNNAQQALMREAFVGPIVDHYGQTERVCMAGACEAGGYHVFPDYGIVEFFPVGDRSNRWEIVSTPLHNWGFPLFRYRTGDQVGPSEDAPCSCGRAFPLLGPIDGRVEDAFTAADGRQIPLPGTIIDNLTGLREAQIVQRAPGFFELRMVPGAGFHRGTTEAKAKRNVERLIGPGQTLTFRTMNRIPRTNGGKLKAAAVVNDLND
jgi:phenylacetate-CoA ligase